MGEPFEMGWPIRLMRSAENPEGIPPYPARCEVRVYDLHSDDPDAGGLCGRPGTPFYMERAGKTYIVCAEHQDQWVRAPENGGAG